ncbi:MAG: hypothetical protein GXY36_17245 [Chloroflexi bacterium]|nr:hypothetical protein [Chloroflexota bacterium]
MSATPHDHDQHESCRHYLRSISEYLDGTLSDTLCDEIEAHMATCENCRVVVNTLSKTVLLYRRLPSPEMPDEVKERLFKVLDLRPYYHADESSEKPAE